MSSGPNRNQPASRSSSAPKMLGQSIRGRHIHSTAPLGATSAVTSQSDRNAVVGDRRVGREVVVVLAELPPWPVEPEPQPEPGDGNLPGPHEIALPAQAVAVCAGVYRHASLPTLGLPAPGLPAFGPPCPGRRPGAAASPGAARFTSRGRLMPCHPLFSPPLPARYPRFGCSGDIPPGEAAHRTPGAVLVRGTTPETPPGAWPCPRLRPNLTPSSVPPGRAGNDKSGGRVSAGEDRWGH